MRIKEVESGSVLVSLDPGECLLLAEACGRTADTRLEDGDRRESSLYDALAANLEALALVGAAGCHVNHFARVLGDWTLPIVRREWSPVTTHQEVAK